MKKRTLALILTLCVTVTAVISFTAGAAAAGGLQEIKAYLNSGVTIKVDGEEKIITESNGVRTYPIVYNGTNYVPIRSIANLLGVDVGWDQATNAILLGKQGEVDLIDTYKAYSIKGQASKQIQSSEGKTENIGGVDVSHWLYLGYYGSYKEAHFNLGGKYTSITFQVYASDDMTLTVYGDEGFLLAEIPITGRAVPKSVTLPLFNTSELFFCFPGEKNTDLYVFDAKLS
ncbi:MAG: hypothetical protein HFF52_03785 [Lawsonibacter sp.]|nr:hypothetical protein [Lawsonibacter sp.]